MSNFLLSFMWVFSHLLTFLFLSKQKNIVNIFILLIMFIFFFNIGLIGDMKHGYLLEIQHLEGSRFERRFELGFIFLVNLFKEIISKNYIYILYSLQILFFLVSLIVIKLFYKKYFVTSLIIFILGIYFFLSVENAYRQGLADLFLLIGIYYLLMNKYLLSLIYFLIAQSIHYSSIFFIFIIIIVFFSLKKNLKSDNLIIKVAFIKYNFIFIVFLIIIYFLIKELYFLFPIDRNNGRDFGLLKTVSIGIIFVLTNYFYVRSFLDKIEYFIFYLRGVFFVLFAGANLIGGSVGMELASRFLFFYFAIESILVVRSFFDNKYAKIAGLIILFTYGIALNVFVLLQQVN